MGVNRRVFSVAGGAVFAAWLWGAGWSAQTTETPERSSSSSRNPVEITLEEYLLRATRHHQRFQELLAEHAALRFYRTINTQSRDYFLELGGSYGLNLLTKGTLPGRRISGPEAYVALKKIFFDTGTEIAATYSIDSPPAYVGGESRYYAFEASVIQPILNNAFGRQNRLSDDIAEAEAELARYQVLEAYEDFLSVVMKGYFQWYANYARLQTARSTHRDNQKILDEMYARQKRNIALPVDVNKIELKTLKSKFELVRIESEYRESMEHIYNYIGLATPDGVNEEQGEFATTTLIPVLPESFVRTPESLEQALADARERGRTFAMFQLLEEKAGLDLDRYEDDLLPSAHLLATYSMLADDPLPAANHTHDIFVGFQVTYPLGNSIPQARKERAALYLKQVRSGNLGRAGQWRADLASLYQRLVTLEKLLEINRRQLDVAREVLRDETTYFQRGRISLNDLIQATQEVEQIKFRMDDLLVERGMVYIEWLRLSDQLVVKMPEEMGEATSKEERSTE